MPGLQGHHWSNSITMATPIAHKGGTAGAKVVATTVIDFLTQPSLLVKAKDYFENVQKKNGEYIQLIPDDAPPPIFLNKEIQSEFREELEKFYYDETKFDTYLEQLGVKYPTLR